MDWPALSADMSPIEHVWDELGHRVRNRVRPPANVAQLSQMLIQEWNNIKHLRIQNGIQSVRHRGKACIQANGDHYRYGINNFATFA